MRIAMLLCLLASSGFGLSCVPPSAQAMYTYADASDTRYLPVVGTFTVSKDTVQSEQTLEHSHKGNNFTAQFSGKALTQQGFHAPFDTDVSVQIACAGPWCGHLPTDFGMLTLLEQRDDDTYRLLLGPCALATLPARKDYVQAFVRCHKGGPCDAPQY
ncbi:MAG: hypothetical protein AAF701_09750 [Pseudomonadota bacterium]